MFTRVNIMLWGTPPENFSLEFQMTYFQLLKYILKHDKLKSVKTCIGYVLMSSIDQNEAGQLK
ncbi:MAG: hypothetical protein K2H82_09460, partial [Oscillospiraceae bacterium]|nr:hypothetical protein [Oscillospiraceae bacterium]